MQPTKLIVLLQTFDKEEMKRFGDYVQSPYFNKREAPINLYKALMPLHPTFETLKWEKVFKKAFSDKTAYSETYLRNVLSDLCSLAEEFLGEETTRSSPIFIGYMVQSLLLKRQFKMAEVNLARLKTSLQTNPDIYPGVYGLWTFYYGLKKFYHDLQEQRLLYSEANQDLATAAKNDSLHTLLESYYNMNTDPKIYYQYEYDTDFFKRFMGIIQPEDFEKEPQVAISYYKLQLQIQPTWQLWNSMNDYLIQNKANLVDSSIFNSNSVLLIFINSQLKKGNELPSGILEKRFALLEESIALLEKNKQPFMGIYFENIVLTGFVLKGEEWAKQYIHDNSPKLPDHLREGMTAYCLARLYFSMGDYTETIAILNAISPFYHHYYFPVKSLLLLAYYEMDNYDAFLTTLDTFKHALKNHPELAQKHHLAHTNMNSILLKLYKLKNRHNPKDILKIKELLQNPDLILNSREWATKKLQEIEAKHTRLVW
jgi:hypothetical protein